MRTHFCNSLAGVLAGVLLLVACCTAQSTEPDSQAQLQQIRNQEYQIKSRALETLIERKVLAKYGNQVRPASREAQLDRASMAEYARILKIDARKFEQCISSGKLQRPTDLVADVQARLIRSEDIRKSRKGL